MVRFSLFFSFVLLSEWYTSLCYMLGISIFLVLILTYEIGIRLSLKVHIKFVPIL